MAITIAANLAKKVPIPGADFSSRQASITITAEVSDLNQVAAEAQRLYALAEQAVDAQLQGPLKVHTVHPPAANAPTPAPTAPRVATRPYTSGPARRPPAPVTDSQLRFLDRLIRDTGTDLNAILQHHQVGSLRDLSCKAAAALIDELRTAPATRP